MAYLGACWLVGGLIYWTARAHVLSGVLAQQEFGLGPFVENLPILLIVFGKFFLPINLSTMVVIQLVSVAIGTVALISIVTFWFMTPSTRNSVILFGFVWYLFLLSPTLLFRHPLDRMAYQFMEHRTYLPCIGIMILLAELLAVRKTTFRNSPLYGIPLLLIITLAGLTTYHCFDYKDGLSFSSAAIASNPRNALAYFIRGSVKFSQGDLSGATSDFSRSIAIKPNYSQAYYNRAIVEGVAQSYTAALTDYDRAIQYDSTRPEMFFNRALVKWEIHDHSGSLMDCNRAIASIPAFWPGYFHRGNLNKAAGNADAALRDYDTAISDFSIYSHAFDKSAYAEVYSNRAEVFCSLDRFGDAINDCERALAVYPNGARAYYVRAQAKSGLMDSEGAIGDYTLAISLDPTYGAAFYGRGKMKYQLNELDDACKDLQVSRSLGYKSTDSLFQRICKK
jgi:tetratricopeptide (TPR) repeat protein